MMTHDYDNDDDDCGDDVDAKPKKSITVWHI